MLAHPGLAALAALTFLFPSQAGDPAVRLSGRLVDELQRPIAKGLVTLLAVPWNHLDSRTTRALGWAVTQSDGRFAMGVAKTLPVSEQPAFVFDLVIETGDIRYERYVRLDASVDLHPGVHDLGQRQAEKALEMVTGTAVDERGELIANAKVCIVHPASTGEPARLEYWLPDPNLVCGGGEFTLRGSIWPPGVFVQAFAPGHLPSLPEYVKFGAENVRLELNRFGWIEGSVQLDEVVARAESFPTLSLHRAGSDGARDFAWVTVGKDQAFRTAPLATGSWELVARHFGLGPAGYTTIQVDVHAGRQVQGLVFDLRGKVPVLHLDVVDEAGAPIETPLLISPSYGYLIVSGAPTSMLALVNIRPFQELTVGADGYRLQRIGPVKSYQRVVLEPGLPVVFSLTPGLPLPPPPWRLAFELDPLVRVLPNHDVDHSWSATFAFDAHGDVRVTLPTVGDCDVMWLLLNGDERKPLGLTRVKIADQKELQWIEIRPDAAKYAAALEKLAKR